MRVNEVRSDTHQAMLHRATLEAHQVTHAVALTKGPYDEIKEGAAGYHRLLHALVQRDDGHVMPALEQGDDQLPDGRTRATSPDRQPVDIAIEEPGQRACEYDAGHRHADMVANDLARRPRLQAHGVLGPTNQHGPRSLI